MIEQTVIGKIQELCAHRHWSLYKLAKESGLPYSSLNNIFTRGTCPTIPTLAQICDGFQISLADFFQIIATDEKISKGKSAPVDGTIQLSADEEDVIYLYRTLSKSDRKLLEAYLQGLSKTPAFPRSKS